MAKPDLAFFNPVMGVVDVIDVDKFDVGTDVLRRRVARASGARGCMRAGKWILTMCAKRPMSRGAGPVAFLHRSAPSTDGRPMSPGELLTSGYEWPVAGSQTIVTTFQLKHKASPAFEGDFTISDCADVLWTLMDHLQVSLSNICGFSLGGAVALEMAQVA